MTPPKTNFQLGYGDYLRFRDLVLERSGLHFPEKKKKDLEIGLFKALADSGLSSVQGLYNLNRYYKLISDKYNPTGQAEMERLINALTIGESHFFRDEAQFNALRKHVLPELIARKRAIAAAYKVDIQPQLRLWSAGCATGQEPYSLAILLKELIPDIDQWRILILATDINQNSLERAKAGQYSDWSFREERAKVSKFQHFVKNQTNNKYYIKDEIKSMVTFASFNLIEDQYPAYHNNTHKLDLIMCRNVTIYFTQSTTRQIVKQFYDSLVDKGWLVVGHAEPSLLIYRAFNQVSFTDTLLYQKGNQPPPWPDDWAALEQPLSPQSPNGDSANSTNLEPLAASLRPPTQSEPAIESSGQHAALNSDEGDDYDIARKLFEDSRLREAINRLQKKLADEPDFAPGHTLLGHIYANLGCWQDAEKRCLKAIELDKLQVEAYYVLSLVYQNNGQLTKTIDMLKKTIYLERNHSLAHFNLAMLYQQQGDLEKTQRQYKNVIRILEGQASDTIIPHSGGTTVYRILQIAHRILRKLEK